MFKSGKPFYYMLSSIIIVACLVLFLVNNRTYTVHFNTGGGTIYPSVQIKSGDKVEKPNDPVMEGYIFEGWYLGTTDEEYDFKAPIKEETTITAKWRSVAEN